MSTSREVKSARIRAAVAAATLALWASITQAETSTNNAGPVQQGTTTSGTLTVNNPAVTISFSGQTALRNFDTSPGIAELNPGGTYTLQIGSVTYTGGEIVLHDGPNGAPITYFIPNGTNARLQLANKDFTVADTNPGTPSTPSINNSQTASAIRLEWHEQGSIDGFYDLINDEVGFAQNGTQTAGGNPLGPISNEAQRVPSASNPTWLNQGSFTAGTGSTPARGFLLDSSTSDNLANTYDATVYTQSTGVNIQHGQNRIQFAVGEPAVEAVSNAGTANVFASAGGVGYGLGNSALTGPSTAQVSSGIGSLTALGAKGARQQFQSSSILNESQSINDPQTDSAYQPGPWNSAGTNNVSSTNIAATAVTYSANPGTGLSRLNKGDSQWLQTTGRLQNGALFNVVARTVDTGQRVVFALNTGVDPSWAVGSNDDGNTANSANATIQHSLGAGLRFDGKTSGSEAEKTIASSRMAVGALSVPEARAASSAAPVRALNIDFNDLIDPTVGGSIDTSKFIGANFDTIVSNGLGSAVTGNSEDNFPRYQAVLISHYNTIKTPSLSALNNQLNLGGLPSVGTFSQFNADGSATVGSVTLSASQLQTAWSKVQTFDPATAQNDSTPASAPISGIKGDTTGDVAAFISNIYNSAGTAAAGLGTASVNNPADNLFVNGFLIPALLDYTRDTDGGQIASVTLSTAAKNEQSTVSGNYGLFSSTDNTPGAGTETTGSNAHYGDGGATGTINGTIPITAKDSAGNSVGDGTVAPAGNYLFGNFNQNGVRDYSAVLESVNAALSLHHVDGAADSIFTADGGTINSTAIPVSSGPGVTSSPHPWLTTADTKGDLITLGDFNGDGKFDGQDVYLLATGASLAANSGTTTLNATASTFADAVRNPNAVLRKNAALTAIQAQLSSPTDPDELFLRKTAESAQAQANDAANNYLNAFNKFDINRDGLVTRQDAQIVDYFIGKNYHNLNDTLGAVVRTDINPAGTAFVDSHGAPLDPSSPANASIPRQQISLVSVELNDTGDISEAGDFSLIRAALGSLLANGDANFDGTVDTADFNTLAANFNKSNAKWSQGDFNLDGVVNAEDFAALAADYGLTAPSAPALGTLVPEPSSLLCLLTVGAITARRRRIH